MKKRIAAVVMAVLTSMTLAGCGARSAVKEKVQEAVATGVQQAAGAATTKLAEAAQTEKESPTDTPAAAKAKNTAKPAQAQPTKETEAQPATEDEESPESFLPGDSLDSYRVYMHTFLTADGETQETESWFEVVNDPPARRMRTIVTDEDGVPEEIETIQIGDETYTRFSDDDQWLVTKSESGMLRAGDVLAPALAYQLSDIGDCKKIGKERVNGMDTVHYRCDENSARWKASPILYNVISGQMDAWVSTKYDLTVKVESSSTINDSEGTEIDAQMSVEYSDINEPIDIVAPEGAAAPALPDDIPMIEGAYDVTIVMPMITFAVDKPLAEVSEYYTSEMDGQGWTYNESESMPPMIASYKKGDRQANIMMGQDGDTTRVTIIFPEEGQ